MSDERLGTLQRLARSLASPRVAGQAPKDFDPGTTASFVREADAASALENGVRLFTRYQARLAAQDTYGLLVILQALDAAGKDGAVKHVMSGVNPQGVWVHSFKVPSCPMS